ETYHEPAGRRYPTRRRRGSMRIRSIRLPPRRRGLSIIQTTFLMVSMSLEQRPLDVSRLDAALLGEGSNDRQKLVPMVVGKPDPVGFSGYRSDPVKQLPDADVDDAIPSWTEEREDRGR